MPCCSCNGVHACETEAWHHDHQASHTLQSRLISVSELEKPPSAIRQLAQSLCATFFFNCLFHSIVEGQHLFLFDANYRQRNTRLFYEPNSNQVLLHTTSTGAWMSDESQLAPHLRL